VFRNGATIEYREAAFDTVLRVGKGIDALRAEAESEVRQQRLAAERAVDDVSRPAGDGRTFLEGLVSLAGAAGIALLVPFAILLIGMPIALAVRGVVETASWLLAVLFG
jgi:hypothetical protein